MTTGEQSKCDHISLTNVRRDRVPDYPAEGTWYRVSCKVCKKFLGYERIGEKLPAKKKSR